MTYIYLDSNTYFVSGFYYFHKKSTHANQFADLVVQAVLEQQRSCSKSQLMSVKGTGSAWWNYYFTILYDSSYFRANSLWWFYEYYLRISITMKLNKQFTWKVRTLLGSRRLQDQVKTFRLFFDCDTTLFGLPVKPSRPL